MTNRTISTLVPAALFALTVLVAQHPAYADEANDVVVEQASVVVTGDVQGSYDPIPESLGD